MIWADWVFGENAFGEECFDDLGFGDSHGLLLKNERKIN